MFGKKDRSNQLSQDLTTGDIGTHIKNIGVPAVIGYFFHTMFNVTDTYFAGEISTTAVSALTLSSSIFFMIIAIGNGMASALTSMVGNALGEKKSDLASKIILNGYLFGFFLSMLLTGVGIFIAPTLVSYLGGEGEYLLLTLGYINVVIVGSVFLFSLFLQTLLFRL
ncbi:MAG: MATE family efflux transporter [Campylobacterales bacterium]|nr:MATE family efflux transporter [Campylobacterales bacterium]